MEELTIEVYEALNVYKVNLEKLLCWLGRERANPIALRSRGTNYREAAQIACSKTGPQSSSIPSSAGLLSVYQAHQGVLRFDGYLPSANSSRNTLY